MKHSPNNGRQQGAGGDAKQLRDLDEGPGNQDEMGMVRKWMDDGVKVQNDRKALTFTAPETDSRIKFDSMGKQKGQKE